MIRLSKLADYGIVLICRIAADRPGKIHAAKDLAAATTIPLPTVSKMTKALARAGLLVSHRGVDGGFALGRPATEISVAQVVEALDGPIAMTDCVRDDHSGCGVEPTCGVRDHWDRISSTIRTALDGLTIADMAKPVAPWAFGKNRQVVS